MENCKTLMLFHWVLVCLYVLGILTSTPNFKENKHKTANTSSGVPDHQWCLTPWRRQMLLLHAHSFPLHLSVLWDTSGETVLHRAASLCHRTICHYLVEAGASLMKTDLQVGSAHTHIRMYIHVESKVYSTPCSWLYWLHIRTSQTSYWQLITPISKYPASLKVSFSKLLF